MKEKFEGGYPKGVMSLMVGEIGFGERYGDVESKLALLEEKQRRALLLLVACDRVYGFFEQRGGVKNGPRLKELVRNLADELDLEAVGGIGDDVSAVEARGYYDQLVSMGVLELAESIGAKDVFCTVWKMINEMVSRPE